MTRHLPKILGALAFVGTMAVGTATPSMAQGVYLDGPGIELGVGPRYHRDYYYYDHGPRYHRYWRHGYSDWD